VAQVSIMIWVALLGVHTATCSQQPPQWPVLSHFDCFWWDWPFTWLTNHCPSVVWCCWLGKRWLVP